MHLTVNATSCAAWCCWWLCSLENYRKSFIRNNRVKKISSEPDALIKRATSGSRAIGYRPCPILRPPCSISDINSKDLLEYLLNIDFWRQPSLYCVCESFILKIAYRVTSVKIWILKLKFCLQRCWTARFAGSTRNISTSPCNQSLCDMQVHLCLSNFSPNLPFLACSLIHTVPLPLPVQVR